MRSEPPVVLFLKVFLLRPAYTQCIWYLLFGYKDLFVLLRVFVGCYSVLILLAHLKFVPRSTCCFTLANKTIVIVCGAGNVVPMGAGDPWIKLCEYSLEYRGLFLRH